MQIQSLQRVLGPMFALLWLSAIQPVLASIDNDSTAPGQGAPDEMCDVWQAIYNGFGLHKDGDMDNDGCSNKVESVAGTDPRNAADCHHVGGISIVANHVVFSFEVEAGKQYRVLSKSNLTGLFETVEPLSQINGVAAGGVQVYKPLADAGNRTVSVVKSGTTKFYKLEVSDLDTDDDGVSDWAEVESGLDPLVKTDSDGDDISDDLEAITAEITVPDLVSIVATESDASEDGPKRGIFTLNRTRSLIPATVSFALSGTAAAPADYASPGAAVSFLAGEKAKQLFVNPSADGAVEGSESVTATLTTTSAGMYVPPIIDEAKKIATVIIGNSTVAAGTGLTARYYDSSSSPYAHAANFGDTANYQYTRAGTTPNFTGTAVITPTGVSPTRLATLLGALTPNTTQVMLSFNGGNLNSATFNHLNYLVTAKTATSFTCAIPPSATLPATSNNSCGFSIQPLHPAVIDRVDPVVNFDWMGGTPNAITSAAAALTGALASPPDNYSTAYETYLSPSTGGSYRFQLDADDRARVLVDLNLDGDFDLPTEQVVEHGWDTAVTGSPEDGTADDEVIGIFKISASNTLSVPASPAQRYKMRIEHVETTGEARCRLQWSRDGGTFANIDQARQFTHTQAATYAFNSTPGTSATITLNGHGLINGDSVKLAFAASSLFTPNAPTPNGYNGTYTVTNATANTFDVAIVGTGFPAGAVTGQACFLEDRPLSGTTGVYNKFYMNTAFANTPGRVGVDAAVTASNNGLWGHGSPDLSLINNETFSIRWSGQVQPQFTEEYTFIVHADEGCTLRLNGQVQEMKTLPGNTLNGGSTYHYDSATGTTIVNYMSANIKAGSVIVGETVRVDPSSGNLNHPNDSTYVYDAATGVTTVTYSNLGTVTPGGYQPGQYVELDPTTGTTAALGNTRYSILAIPAPTANTFSVSFGSNAFASQTTAANINITDNRGALVTAVYAAGTGSYTYNTTTGFTVVNYAALNLPPNSIISGMSVLLDPSSGNISGQVNAFQTVTDYTPTSFTVAYPAGSGAATGNIIIVAPSVPAFPTSQTTAFAIALDPGLYTSASIGNTNIDIVNKPLKDWSSMGSERYVRIPMVGGVRYDIQLDFYENGGYSRCALSWFSPSQTKQVIPTERLYPSSGTIAPAAHVGSTTATALVGGPFSYTVGGTNGGAISATGLPDGLTLSGGVISGTPTVAGSYQILITITNIAGTSTSVLNLDVENAGGTVPREFWNGVAGTSVASIPFGNTPTGTTNLTSLEGPTNFGDNYGARVRGYITAPETGNYYFWLAASNAAELWISNDAEPVNTFRRAWVTTGNATPQTWTGEANQMSPWLALEQGKKYYFEILHKAGTDSGDNVAVGWSKPGQPTNSPSQVVPGYVLSPYVAPTANSSSGTLYLGTMLAQGGAVTSGVGSSTLRLSTDENTAYMKRSFAGLTGPITSEHIHTDPYLTHGSTIVFDIDAPVTPGDGMITNASDPNFTGTDPQVATYRWTILPVGTLSKADIIEVIKQGKAYVNLHTAAYPNGEIRGNYTLANGTRIFTPPPASPSWSDDSNTDAGASRFLTQATFGANIADIAALKSLDATGEVPASGIPASRYNTWIDDQFTKPVTQQLPEVLLREIADVFGAFDVRVAFNTWWKTSMTAPDQLRQRVAFALSEIHVVSGEGPLEDNSRALADFYDTLATNAFGNFRTLLGDTTLTPAMGRYLDMLRNDKPDLSVGRIPNENYAREIKQLFSIGLYRMWPDGTLMLTSNEVPIDTYTQREIVGLSHVFTGWDYGYDGAYRTAFSAPGDWTRPMREVPARHFTGQKRVLNNEVLPGLPTLSGQTLDPYATHTTAHFNEPAYQALAAHENTKVHDMLFNHPNTGPFICRQLIQRMVTSHPSRDYLYRVVQKFNDNGFGVRGDMKAVIKAILLDYEARSSNQLNIPAFGKQREPIMVVAQAARAFRPSGVSGTYEQNGSNLISITTTTPHLLANGNIVFLEFTDGTTPTAQQAPTSGSYTVTVTSPTTYTIPAPGWMTGTYSQSGTTITVTMNGHWLPGTNASQSGLPSANFGQAYFDFTSGPANGVSSFDQTVRTTTFSTSFDTPSGVGNISGTTFTLTAPYSATTSGQTVMISRFPSSYSCTGAGGTITIDTTYGGAGAYGAMADHGLSVGDSVFLNFMNSRDTTSFNETSTTNDVVYTINGVPDANTFTVQALSAPNAAMNSDNQVTVFPHKAQPTVRNGTVNTRQGTFNMDNTDNDLAQTPLNSSTVFNYFLPDYKYSGTLASQGLTTPEFQLTAETTAIRQSNFIYNGLFNPGNSNGISSFKSGSHALVLDLAPWMGATASNLGLGDPASTSVPWTHNQNLSTLISQLNTLLLAGQLPATSAAIIKNFVATPIASIGLHATSCLVTTSVNHKLNTGDTVVISGVTDGTFGGVANSLNNTTGTRLVTRVSETTFTIPLSCTVAPTAGGLINAHVSVVQYNQGTPTPIDTNKRDRLRSIMHLILTSPDYTIQR